MTNEEIELDTFISLKDDLSLLAEKYRESYSAKNYHFTLCALVAKNTYDCAPFDAAASEVIATACECGRNMYKATTEDCL